MGSLCKSPSPPPAPDPVAVANAQSASNIATAQEQQRLNMINTAGPDGTVNYASDTNAPGGYSQTTTLSPSQQAIYNAQTQAQSGALDTANTQLGRVNDALATPLSTDGLPQLSGGNYSGVPALQTGYDIGGSIKSQFNQGGPLQYGFSPGQQVQGQIGPQDLAGAYQTAANASYGQAQSRLDPQFAQSENALRTKLANQGLSQNDSAYQTALQNFSQNKNDAYNQADFSAQNQGLTAENTLFGQSAQQGQFANSAAAQEYTQNQGQAGFNNQTANQAYTQNLGAAQFANSAQSQYNQEQAAQAQFANSANLQGFNEAQSTAQLGDQARQQGLQERAYLQNEPIDQFTGLLSLGQVATPQGVNYTPSQVAPTDVIGANALATQAQQANYNAQMQKSSGMMNGLMSLGSAAIMGSDRRLKRNVRRIGWRDDGIALYSFEYISGGPRRIGVMAQELRRVRPDLVLNRADGYMAVNYAGLPPARFMAELPNASRLSASGRDMQVAA